MSEVAITPADVTSLAAVEAVVAALAARAFATSGARRGLPPRVGAAVKAYVRAAAAQGSAGARAAARGHLRRVREEVEEVDRRVLRHFGPSLQTFRVRLFGRGGARWVVWTRWWGWGESGREGGRVGGGAACRVGQVWARSGCPRAVTSTGGCYSACRCRRELPVRERREFPMCRGGGVQRALLGLWPATNDRLCALFGVCMQRMWAVSARGLSIRRLRGGRRPRRTRPRRARTCSVRSIWRSTMPLSPKRSRPMWTESSASSAVADFGGSRLPWDCLSFEAERSRL